MSHLPQLFGEIDGMFEDATYESARIRLLLLVEAYTGPEKHMLLEFLNSHDEKTFASPARIAFMSKMSNSSFHMLSLLTALVHFAKREYALAERHALMTYVVQHTGQDGALSDVQKRTREYLGV